MRQNIFMGGGFFGPARSPIAAPELGQLRYGYQQSWARPMTQQWTRRPSPAQRVTRPTSQPTAAAGSGSEVGCYFCPDLPGAPTYWMSADQVRQWNDRYGAGCVPVKAQECQNKYGQLRSQPQARLRQTGFNAFNLPPAAQMTAPLTQYAAPTYGSMMTGRIRVENPELVG
jgi:hypothetical protein